MAKCKEHEWQIVSSFSVVMRIIRKYACSQCKAVKYTVVEGRAEEEISAERYNDFWKEYLSDR